MSLLSNENSPDDLFSFAGSVGRFGDNNRDDVIKAQALLANAGYYDLPEPGMPTGWPGGELNRALTRFQKDHGLDPDGTLLPLGPSGVAQNGVGETAQALQDELGDRLKGFAAPEVQEADDFYRLRPMLAGEGEPQTDVRLRGDNSTGEYIGLKPVMSDAPPADYELKPGQQEARAGGPSGVRTAPQPARPPMARPPAMTPQQPRSTPPQHGPYPPIPRERIPDERQREPSIIQRLQTPTPESDTDRAQLPPIENRPNAPGLGRVIIAEDGKELYVPPLGSWAKDLSPPDRQIADGLSDAFAIEMARPGSRGDEWTQKGVDMYVQGCLQAAKEDLPKLAENLQHIAGGTEDNDGKTPVKEEHLANVIDGMRVRLGSGRSDFTLEFSRNVVQRFRANTTSKLADGATNTPDEQRRLENMDRLTLGNGDYVAEFPKFPKGMSDAEMKKQARKACGEELAKWFEEIAKTGEFEKPAPKKEQEYYGHRILDDLKKDLKK